MTALEVGIVVSSDVLDGAVVVIPLLEVFIDLVPFPRMILSEVRPEPVTVLFSNVVTLESNSSSDSATVDSIAFKAE